MAVPKRKMSKARRDSRRANWKLTAPFRARNVMSRRCPIVFAPSAVTTMAEKSLLRTSKKLGVSRM